MTQRTSHESPLIQRCILKNLNIRAQYAIGIGSVSKKSLNIPLQLY